MLTTLLATWLATTTPVYTPKQDLYLAKVMDCESSGSSTIKIVDSNGYYSYGAFMFQQNTWLSQSAKYGLGFKKEDIFDYNKQKYLAHLMLLDGGKRNWFTCTKKLGEYPTD